MANTRLALHFAVIGAQKAGTTSLHEYLGRHPNVVLPRGKEAAFFSECADCSDQAWQAYARSRYPATAGRVLGKVCPQYLGDPRVPARLSAVAPEARLVVILREPVARAYSHWRMCVRRGWETRDFVSAARALMAPGAATAARARPAGRAAETLCYLAWSEYARLLGLWQDKFPRHQILVLFTDDLARDPGATLDTLLLHIGQSPGFRPSNLGRRYQVGGERELVPGLWKVLESPAVRALWRHLPERWRRPVGFWLHASNTRRVPPAVTDLPEPFAAELREWFGNETRRLSSEWTRPPWAF